MLLAGLFGCAQGATVVVRHAEKQPGIGNMSLTTEGQQRARALAQAIRGKVTQVYATHWCRTIQTAEPTALAAGVPIHVQRQSYDQAGHSQCEPAIRAEIRMLPPEVDTAAKLAAHIEGNREGGTTLVVGHSNTVDDLVAGVGGGRVSELTEKTYDRMFIVARAGGRPSWFVVRYGAPATEPMVSAE